MLNNVTIGQFFPGDSYLYHLDPRTKLILTIAMIVLVFIAKSFIGFALVFLFVLWCALSTKIGMKYMLKGLKPLLVIIGLTFFLNLFLLRDGEDLLHFGIIRITTGGVRMAVFMAVRLILLVLCSQVLTLTTSPIALTDAMEILFGPLKKLKVPVHEMSMMMSMALRFIPTLIEETDKIMSAQKARGADFETGNLFQRARALLPLLVPLFVSAFRRADELAVAMECRCYHGDEGRTRMKQLTWCTRDTLAMVWSALVLAGVIVLARFGL